MRLKQKSQRLNGTLFHLAHGRSRPKFGICLLHLMFPELVHTGESLFVALLRVKDAAAPYSEPGGFIIAEV